MKPWRRTARNATSQPPFGLSSITYAPATGTLTLWLTRPAASSTTVAGTIIGIAVDATRRMNDDAGTIVAESIVFPTVTVAGGNAGSPRATYSPGGGAITSPQGQVLPAFANFPVTLI